MNLTVFGLLVAYGDDSGTVMAASVLWPFGYFDQNGLVPRWSY